MKSDCILLLSGGIDSTTLLADLVKHDHVPECLIFNYGQTLQREIEFAVRNARRWNALHRVIYFDLTWTAQDCALFAGQLEFNRTVDQIRNNGTPSSYVPFRNGIFLSLAVAFGEGHGIRRIYCGGNGLASGNYWDDTAEFARQFEEAARVGTAPTFHPQINFPWANISKKKIVERGHALGVEYKQTWSCYQNGEAHCGQCDSCVQRWEALSLL